MLRTRFVGDLVGELEDRRRIELLDVEGDFRGR